MLVPQFTILYVANPTRSALFYRELFGRPPVEEVPHLYHVRVRVRRQTGTLVQRHGRTRRDPNCRGHGAGLRPPR